MLSDRRLRIVIPGGSGHLGTVLARHFSEQGHSVAVICRRAVPAEWQVVHWNGCDLGDWAEAMDGADVVINLAGRSVNCRYNSAHQREIMTSRTISTGVVGRAIAECAHPPSVWLNASTATIYRHSFDRVMDERSGEFGGNEPNAPRKWAFSIEVAKNWEAALFAADTPKTRRVAMRISVVMSPEPHGPFERLLHLVRLGFGGPCGSGSQYVSWIHDVDFIRAVEFLIARSDLDGPVNLASPGPVPNQFFMRCLRNAWCTTYIGIPTPTWLLGAGAALLRTETELVLKSRRVVPARLREAGFEFHFPNWRAAAQDLVHRWRELNNDEGPWLGRCR